jgi:YacP-like NYN domain-containing protein
VTAEAPLVVVDARNVMRSRWPNIPEDSFLDLVRSWAEQEGAGVVAVFDGRAPGDRFGVHVLDDRLTIVGTGTGSADDWIAEHAPELARDRGRLWLVTSDRELRRRAEGVVERLLGGGSFAGTLVALEREPG